jgi:GAF domain-containing protein
MTDSLATRDHIAPRNHILTRNLPPTMDSLPAADGMEQADADTRFQLAVGIAEVIHSLGGETGPPSKQALVPLLARIVEGVPGARYATLVSRPNLQKPLVTFAATGSLAAQMDQLQGRAGQGPCLDSLVTLELIQVDDLAVDQRWPALAALKHPVPIRSVLSVPVHACNCATESLNLYAESPYAFGPSQHPAAYLAAAALSLAVTALHERERAEHLRIALDTNRQIGAAMGILMARHRCSSEQAFTALRMTSQHLHRKLREVADEVIYTGVLPSRRDRRTIA